MKRCLWKSARSVVGALFLLSAVASGAGCLDRELAPQQPSTTQINTQLYRSTSIDKIDLLFMIDNSASMADKQDILAEAVPDLLKRLTQPRCLDSLGKTVDKTAEGNCPAGTRFEFQPVKDIHVGVISSSLGGEECTGVSKPQQADMAHLITRTKDESKVQTWQDKGFLVWDPDKKATPPGESDASVLIKNFTDIVRGTGQDGCGMEASLESWYRFLVDPKPYKRLVPAPCTADNPGDLSCRAPEGVDETVLQNRADFLRSDSLLAIVMLTDENDCSLVDSGQAFLTGVQGFTMFKGTAACQTDPASPECVPCNAAPNDPGCSPASYTPGEDDINLRCFRQKQRFGLDWLWPVKRYINGLTRKTFTEEDLARGFNQGFAPNADINPLFCSDYEEVPDPQNPGMKVKDRTRCKTVLRDSGLVFFAGILGVPWQDIAVDPSDLKKGYRPVEELSWSRAQFERFNSSHTEAMKTVPPGLDEGTTVWDHVLGKLDGDFNIDYTVEPKDPFMIDSIKPRSGVNPATGESVAPPESSSPKANRINGHEWSVSGARDLQYACTFKLPPGKERVCQPDDYQCDCGNPEGKNNPLCQSETGTYGTTQYRAKAYPGRRQLAVLKGIDPRQSIVASICAENTTDSSAADYGYTPAMGAILERLRYVLQGTCWADKLSPDADGQVDCVVLEATKGQLQSDGTTTCQPCGAGRLEASQQARRALVLDPNYQENDLHCVCEIPQAEAGEKLEQCIGSSDDSPVVGNEAVNGWCYVDPSANGGKNQQLVATCPTGAKQMIRFVGAGQPEKGALTFLQCRRSSLGSN